MTKIYYQGETMHQGAEVSTKRGIPIDADVVITIVDPVETIKIDEQAMTQVRTGEYIYDYLIEVNALIGKWKTEVKASKGFIAIEQDKFTVLEAIG